MKITGKASIDLSKYRKTIQKRVDAAKSAVGDKVASSLVEEVKKNVPNQGGWYDIYRNSLKFNNDENKWEVVGETSIELTQVPADKSLVVFSGPTQTAAILAAFNPYPIDTIPPIVGGITAEASILAASQSEVMSHRERHAGLQSEVTNALSRSGMRVNWVERPVINGKVTADLKFLSKRLEHGLGGFPRIPHWSAAVGEAKRSATKWVSQDQEVGKALESSFRASE